MPITVKKHSGLQTVIMHLWPGLVNLLAIILLTPLASVLGYAENGRLLAGNLMVVVAMVPAQIGFLLYTARKTTNSYNIFKLTPYFEKSKPYEYAIFIVVMILWALGVQALLTPFEHGIRDSLFAFVPESFVLRSPDYTLTPKALLVFAASFEVLTNGFLAPVTEELYFRGYLLPRINATPFASVIVSAVLFSLYHFFSPWYFFSRVLMMIPMYFWAVKRRNIRFTIMAHIIANVFTSVSFLLSILRLA